MSDPFHIKYRPAGLDDVVGQDAITKSLAGVLSDDANHTFLFTGPAGCGKTTLARIVARELGVPKDSIDERDAAQYSKVEDMRALVGELHYKGFGENPRRMIILDECHALSKAAWQVLLKATEEPPEHVYWAFCTTEAGKVPKTIETRAISYVLKPIKRDALFDLLDHVCEQEELNEFDDKMIQAVVNRAQGSARQALVYLQQVAHCETLDELKEAIDSLDEDDDQVIELCRTLSKKGTGVEVARLLKELKEKETNPEGIRIQVANYYAAVAIGAKGDAKRIAALDVLDLFVDPLHDQGGWPKLVLNCFAAVTE